MTDPHAAIVIPCYNEHRRLDARGFAELTPHARLIFVDDGSTDGTRHALQQIAAAHPDRAEVLALAQNQGKAEAVRRGMLLALRTGADIIGYLDADLATPPAEMLRLLRTLEQTHAEAVLGARVALLGASIERKLHRQHLGRAFATCASLLLDLPVYDTQCGAKLFRATPLLAAALATPFNARWAFDVELIGRLRTGAPGIDGIAPRAFREVPLERWRDVSGSTLRATHFPLLALELARIAYALEMLRRRTRAHARSL